MVLTVVKKTPRCGFGRVQLSVNDADLFTIKVLVVERKLLDFNLLLEMDTIRVCIN